VRCPACSGEVWIAAFITERAVIDRILDHQRRKREGAQAARGPPAPGRVTSQPRFRGAPAASVKAESRGRSVHFGRRSSPGRCTRPVVSPPSLLDRQAFPGGPCQALSPGVSEPTGERLQPVSQPARVAPRVDLCPACLHRSVRLKPNSYPCDSPDHPGGDEGPDDGSDRHRCAGNQQRR
jgi:hypothetical protein